jgi:glutamine amidotransferase
MCRLFGLHAGVPVDAEFWLIDAPDSLSAQSHRNPDGAGVGAFGPDGTAVVSKQPIAAWQDAEFATAARRMRGTTFVAHVRYASTGEYTVDNTHPFLEDARLFAHNGVVQGLPDLDRHLADAGAAGLVRGQTDSERVFALITAETRRHGGDVGEGITAAIGWISDRLPVYAVNLVLATATSLWALRYPATHELCLLGRPAGSTRASSAASGAPGGGASPEVPGAGGGVQAAGGDAGLHARGRGAGLDARSGRIHARSAHLADRPSVIIASERMDDDPGWRLLDPGELVEVEPDLNVRSTTPFPSVPRHLLQVSDLAPAAAASQRPHP